MHQGKHNAPSFNINTLATGFHPDGGGQMTLLTIVIVIALLATVGTLLWGIVSMAKGGEFDQHHSHQLMFARVGLQGVTLLFLLIALYIAVK
jgi:hypothetical protein